MSKRNKEPQDRYIQLHHYMLKTDAWKALSAAAVSVYIRVASRYNGPLLRRSIGSGSWRKTALWGARWLMMSR